MRISRIALFIGAIAMSVTVLADGASAQKMNRVTPGAAPSGGGGGYSGGGGGGGGNSGRNFATGVGVGLAIGVIAPAIIGAMQQPAGAQEIDDPGQRRPPRQPSNPQGRPSGAPPAGETRYAPDEVVIEIRNSTPQLNAALAQRHRLTPIELQTVALTNTTFVRWRITDRRSVTSVIRALEADARVASTQPNYRYTLQQQSAPPPSLQYAPGKMKVQEAHAVTKGSGILVAVIDSGIDANHPALQGAIAGAFNALETPHSAHPHGTGIAGLIAARTQYQGVAPDARILAIRAFDAEEGSTFSILKGLDWAAANGARIINMSFAGPADPVTSRSLAAARKKGITLIAASGNAGPKSPALYPAADPNVIAVTATDAEDKIFTQANRGRHIEIAAPGVDIVVLAPEGGYKVSSGTSMAAAEVSGVVALMLQNRPDLSPDAARARLRSSAKDLGPKGRDDNFGAGLVDAYAAVSAPEPMSASATAR